MTDTQPKVVSGLQLWQWRHRAIQAAIATDVAS